MLKISFDLKKFESVSSLLPDGYRFYQDSLNRFGPNVRIADTFNFSNCPGNYLIMREDGFFLVGFFEVGVKMGTIKFFDGNPDDEPSWKFIKDFGIANPELNPLADCFGFVFGFDDGTYILEDMPLLDRKRKMKEVVRFVAEGKAFFVTYFRGYRNTENVTVRIMRRIMFDTQLDIDEGPRRLRLR